MCIIITKERSAKPLPEEIFSIIWDHNPDGAGILYNDGKKTTLKKGLMKKDDFLKIAKQVNKSGISYIMHTRIATHGSVKPENTHPFVSKYLGFAHNGTFSVVPFPDKTDSETFFMGAIGNKKYKWCEDNKFLLDMATHGCRCAIMDLESGKIMHLCEEDWKTDIKYKGYKFSNTSYENYALVYNSKSGTHYDNRNYGRYDNYSRYGYWDDEDDFWDYDTDKKEPKEEPEPRIIDKIDNEMFDKKSDMLMFNKEWIKPFLQDGSIKTNAKDEVKIMNQTLQQMGSEYYEAKKIAGKDSYEALAIGIILNFTAYAKGQGYNNVVEVMSVLKEMVNMMDEEQTEEKLLKDELLLQIQEWR